MLICDWEMCFCSSGVFADSDAVKSISKMEGDSVTLPSDLTEIQKDGVITWTFGDTGVHNIAHINKEARHFNTCDAVLDGRFRDRLKLDHQTGSLTIKNIRITDSGLYQVTISASKQATHRFNVAVYGELQLHVWFFCLLQYILVKLNLRWDG